MNPFLWYHKAIRETKTRWLIILLTIAYFLLPFDLSPDIFPIVGQIDDGLLFLLFTGEIIWLWLENSSKNKKTNLQKNAENLQDKDKIIDVDFKAKSSKDSKK